LSPIINHLEGQGKSCLKICGFLQRWQGVFIPPFREYLMLLESYVILTLLKKGVEGVCSVYPTFDFSTLSLPPLG
jgi:hypothetical protein